jgi:hypothetical protein
MIFEICRETPDTKHWLPTREYELLSQAKAQELIPENLTVRWSGNQMRDIDKIDSIGFSCRYRTRGEPGFSFAEAVRIPLGSLTWAGATKKIGAIGGLLCQAKKRNHTCGSCRACWNPNIKHVVYPAH